MKTKEELNAIKKEVEALSNKLAELSEDELEQVSGGDEIRYLWSMAFSPLFPRIPEDPEARDSMTHVGINRTGSSERR